MKNYFTYFLKTVWSLGFVFCLATHASAGSDFGDGGDSVKCTPSNENPLNGIYVLDFVVYQGWERDLREVKTWEESFDFIEKQIDQIWPRIKKKFLDYRTYIFNEKNHKAPRIWHKEPYKLADLKDEDIETEDLPENCRQLNEDGEPQFIQTIIRKENSYSKTISYEYDYSITEDYRKNNAQQLSFLLFHEFLRDVTQEAHVIRYLNLLFHSTAVASVRKDDMQRFLAYLEIERLSFGGVPTDIDKKLIGYIPTFFKNQGHPWSQEKVLDLIESGAHPDSTNLLMARSLREVSDKDLWKRFSNFFYSKDLSFFARHDYVFINERPIFSPLRGILEFSTGIRLSHLAAYFGKQEFLEKLALKGADLSLKDAVGRSVFHYALAGGHLDLAKSLAKKDPPKSNDFAAISLGAHTIYFGKKDEYDFLVSIGLKDRIPINLMRILSIAAYRAEYSLTESLIKLGLNVNQPIYLENKNKEEIENGYRYGLGFLSHKTVRKLFDQFPYWAINKGIFISKTDVLGLSALSGQSYDLNYHYIKRVIEENLIDPNRSWHHSTHVKNRSLGTTEDLRCSFYRENLRSLVDSALEVAESDSFNTLSSKKEELKKIQSYLRRKGYESVKEPALGRPPEKCAFYSGFSSSQDELYKFKGFEFWTKGKGALLPLTDDLK